MQITIPMLNNGETYTGIVVVGGNPTHHLVLLPGDRSGLDWEKAKAWAEKQGGELPTRREQALLFANAPDEFKPDWYWSCEQHAASSGCAWFQYFYYGGQYYGYISNELRARAVRRIAIQ